MVEQVSENMRGNHSLRGLRLREFMCGDILSRADLHEMGIEYNIILIEGMYSRVVWGHAHYCRIDNQVLA